MSSYDDDFHYASHEHAQGIRLAHCGCVMSERAGWQATLAALGPDPLRDGSPSDSVTSPRIQDSARAIEGGNGLEGMHRAPDR